MAEIGSKVLQWHWWFLEWQINRNQIPNVVFITLYLILGWIKYCKFYVDYHFHLEFLTQIEHDIVKEKWNFL